MRSHIRSYLLLGLCASLVALAACTKKKDDAPAEPANASAPEVDPRLAADPAEQGEHGATHPPAGDAGAAGDPHGGAAAGNPHGGTNVPPPMAGGMGTPGKLPEKTSDGRVILGPVTAAVPKKWKEKPPKSNMRAAEWIIPGKAGDAELAVFYFGAGGAGGAKANLDRWIGQFEQPDGSPSASKAKIEEKKVADMPVTFVEVAGRYVAAMTPGAQEKHDKADHMMLAAILETAEGPYYFKLVGPQATVTAARKDFRGFIESHKPSADK
jgi:hypothetical protein